jgi:cobalt-zinc-cadmium efflux system outer membrane protein
MGCSEHRGYYVRSLSNRVCRRLVIAVVAAAAAAGGAISVGAQLVSSSIGKGSSDAAISKLTLRRFVNEVARSNVDLAAQQYNVSIAKAQLVAARVSPNPTFNAGATRDVSDKQQPATENAGLSQTIEVGGKRHFRVSVATKNVLASSATLEDFFRTLRGTAANAFIDAVASDMIVQQKGKAAESLRGLADLNRFRLKEGDIAEVDYNQAAVDSLQAEADFTAAKTTASNAILALVQLLGKRGSALPRPSSDLKIGERNFEFATLLERAMQTRPDVVAARHVHASALASVSLSRANRFPDVTLSAGLQQNESGRNPINPSPNFNLLNVGLSVPLPVFNSFRGEYLVAANTALQSEKTLQSVELKAEVDVRQNFERFRLAKQRAARYEGAILDLAAKVLDARLAAYKTGGATLLDVLTAQKAETDVRLAAIDALSERAKALVALEQAANIWDVDL